MLSYFAEEETGARRDQATGPRPHSRWQSWRLSPEVSDPRAALSATASRMAACTVLRPLGQLWKSRLVGRENVPQVWPGLWCQPPFLSLWPLQLLQEIWKVNFTLLGHEIFFDKQGNLLMSLEVIQWRWDLSQNPFQSITSYYPALRRRKATHNVSWHTANNTAGSRTAAGGPGPGAGRPARAGVAPGASGPRSVIDGRWRLYLWGECLGPVPPSD